MIIDVSEHNGLIDWEITKEHIDGAIILYCIRIIIQVLED